MSDHYTKLFSSITTSTIWCEPAGTRLLWITMLSMKNRLGEVFGSIPGMASVAKISIAECEAGIAVLLAPDPYSRTKDEGGRRIAEIDGGWIILNHAKFCKMGSADEKAERKRESDREWDRNNRPSGHARVAVRAQSGTVLPHVDVDVDVDVEDQKLSCASATAEAPPTRLDPIPYQAIVDAYNSALTALPKVRELTAKRRTLIRSAWNSSPSRRSTRFWESYFSECADDPFLSGAGPYREPHENWRPSFDYLLADRVITRVYEKALDRIDRGAA